MNTGRVQGGSLAAHTRRVSLFGVIRVQGDDSGLFLQGQTTTDVLSLKPGGTLCGAFLTPKGRVLANFRLSLDPGGYALLVPIDRLAILEKRLKMFILRSRVKLECSEYPEGLCWHQAPPEEQTPLPIFKLSDKESLAPFPSKEAAMGAIESNDAMRLSDIRRGFAWITEESQEAYLPQMLNLDQLEGISYQKGCYTGQEIVARTHFLGQLKRRLFRFCFEHQHPLTIGSPLYLASGEATDPIGTIVNVAPDIGGRFECLAVVQIDKVSESIRAQGPQGPLLARCDPPTRNDKTSFHSASDKHPLMESAPNLSRNFLSS